MISHAKHLPADERRAVIVQSVITLAATNNPSEITTAAIAKHMGLTQGLSSDTFQIKKPFGWLLWNGWLKSYYNESIIQLKA